MSFPRGLAHQAGTDVTHPSNSVTVLTSVVAVDVVAVGIAVDVVTVGTVGLRVLL